VADELVRLAADLGRIPDELTKTLRPALLRVGETVRADAASRASWSTRIPGAMSVRPSVTARGGASVTIRVSAAKAPHARPFENAGQPGSFRHPVHADGPRSSWTWVAQDAHPFLFPAARAHREQTVKAIGDAAEDAARRHGFH